MPQILPNTLSEQNQDLIGRFEATDATVVLLNITMDHGIATVLSVLRSRSPEAPGLVFAAATQLDPELAVRKSLEELAHTRRMAQELKLTHPPFLPEPGFTNVVNQTCHVQLYADQKHSQLADFLFAGEHRISFDDIPNNSRGSAKADVEALVHRLAALNYQALVVDLTTPDVREIGLHVVRAIIPGFHPLFFGHSLRALGGTRLWQVPPRLGYEGITVESGDNPAPHPYP
jgi:ribosomal protein S12 methylthiotransferase accessory factor